MSIRAGTLDGASRDLVFRVGAVVASIPAASVLEVIREPRLTSVPLAPASLAGLMNFHGRVVAVVRLAELLEAGPTAGGAAPFVVMFDGDEPIGLLVDEIVRMEAAGSEQREVRRLDVSELLKSGWAVAAPRVAPVRTGSMAVERSDSAGPSRALLGFAVSKQFYALPLDVIREVIAVPEAIALMPHAGAMFLGVVPLREGVLPLVSLARLLGLPEDAGAGKGDVIVAEFGSWRLGLLTGAVDKVLRIPESAIEAVPHLLRQGDGDAEIDAIGRIDGGRGLVSILSLEKLLGNERIASAFLEGGAVKDTVNEGTVDMATEQFIVLVLGKERFGLPIGAVDEIVELPSEMARMPNAPPFVAGVMNLRGRPLPVIDQRTRFQTLLQSPRAARVAVVTVDRLQAGFIVDDVSDIVRVDTSAIGPAPSLPGETSRVFDRVAAVADDGAMLLLIDPRELLDRAERELLTHLEAVSERATAS